MYVQPMMLLLSPLVMFVSAWRQFTVTNSSLGRLGQLTPRRLTTQDGQRVRDISFSCTYIYNVSFIALPVSKKKSLLLTETLKSIPSIALVEGFLYVSNNSFYIYEMFTELLSKVLEVLSSNSIKF